MAQQEHALERLTDALLALRRGAAALREENRELRVALEETRRMRATTEGFPLADERRRVNAHHKP
ncbi:MAG: hypothetical protein ACXVFT_17635 [Solirubrobacteraceae bacterium]